MAGNNIKAERARYGYTQRELAKMLGVSYVSVKNWEKDIGSCKVSNILSLSNIFGVSSDYLIGLTDDRRRKT